MKEIPLLSVGGKRTSGTVNSILRVYKYYFGDPRIDFYTVGI